MINGYTRRRVKGKDHPTFIRGVGSEESGEFVSTRGILIALESEGELYNFRESLCDFQIWSGARRLFAWIRGARPMKLMILIWNLAEFEATRLDDWLALFFSRV